MYQAFLRYQVLLFPPQDLPPARQVAFARRFGEVQIHVMNQYHADGFPELYRLSNLDENGKPNGQPSGQGHAGVAHGRLVAARHRAGDDHLRRGHAGERRRDAFLRHVRRLRAADAAWKARIAGLRAVHNLDFSRTRRHGEDPLTEAQRLAKPPVDHPVVRTHPETGRKCLYLGDHAEYIVGMPYDEGRALIEELNALAVHPDLTYEHRWKTARADRLGQPLRDASRDGLRCRHAGPRHPPLHRAGRSPGLGVLDDDVRELRRSCPAATRRS